MKTNAKPSLEDRQRPIWTADAALRRKFTPLDGLGAYATHELCKLEWAADAGLQREVGSVGGFDAYFAYRRGVDSGRLRS